MPILGGDSFFGLLETYRVLTFDGRYGGGKTALSFYCGHHLLKTGRFRYLLSNTRSVWCDNPNDVVLRPNEDGEPVFMDAVIILDEAGLFLKYSEDAQEFLAFLRKGNIVILCPSVEEVARSLRGVTVQRLANLEIIGLPLWIYGYKLRRGMQKDQAKFIWRNPSEIYGIYDSAAPPVDDAGIGDLLLDWKDIIVTREKVKQKKSGMRYERKPRTRSGVISSGVQTSAIEGLQPAGAERVYPVGAKGRDVSHQAEQLEGILEEITEVVDRSEAISINWKKRRH